MRVTKLRGWGCCFRCSPGIRLTRSFDQRSHLLSAVDAAVGFYVSLRGNARVGAHDRGSTATYSFCQGDALRFLPGPMRVACAPEMMPVAIFALIASVGALLAYRRRID